MNYPEALAERYGPPPRSVTDQHDQQHLDRLVELVRAVAEGRKPDDD